MGQLEAYGYADEHAEPRLLGDERAHCPGALLLILLPGDTGYLGVVHRTKPAAFAERFGEYPLQGRGGVHDHVLRVRETSWLDQRGERRVHLGCRVGTVWQSHPIIGGACLQTVLTRLKPKPNAAPSAAPATPASQLTSGRA
jgi:hypothetical protein